MIKIDFSFETPYGRFCDALYFEDVEVPDDSVIEALKLERLNNWLAFLNTPPEETKTFPVRKSFGAMNG